MVAEATNLPVHRPPPLPSGKIGEGHLLFFLIGGGFCTQASHEHVQGLPKTKKKSTVKFMHEFNWNSLKQLTFYWISGSASNQKLTLATNQKQNKNKQWRRVKNWVRIIILFKKQNYSRGLHVGVRNIVSIRRCCFWFFVSLCSLILDINTLTLNTEGIEYESRQNDVDKRRSTEL